MPESFCKKLAKIRPDSAAVKTDLQSWLGTFVNNLCFAMQ